MQDKRFVIQEHTTSQGVHWDLMLEQDDGLTTFRLPTGANDRSAVRAERIVDHPLRFLWYEGPVQNGTGRVRIVDRGTWSAGGGDPPLAGSASDGLAFHLGGAILHGDFALTRITEAEWRFERRSASGG